MSVTLIIVIVTCLVSLFAFQNRELFNRLQFNAYLINHNRQWYRFFSYGLIHADFLHLAVNMYVLYTFGQITNYFYTDFFGVKGSYYYVLLYVASLFTSTIYSFELHKRNSWYNAVGASGAVSAVVFTSIYLVLPLNFTCCFCLFLFPQ
jgi:membrane associated rhomboid family serine protease